LTSLSARIVVFLSNLISRWWPPSFERYEDELAYSRWQMENAEQTYQTLYHKFSPFEGKRVLDLGCGEGGKTTYYAGRGPSIIVGIDIGKEKIARARKFCSSQGRSDNCHFLVCSADHLPFKLGVFDIVISEDCFDHYSRPESVVAEVHSILREGGVFLVRFDTYYNWGGSHLYNFIRIPWVHLFFSDETLIEATRLIARQLSGKRAGEKRRETYEEQAEREIYQFKHFVNRITLKRWRKMIGDGRWRILWEDTQALGRRIPLLRLPLLEELYNSLFYVLEKKAA